HAGHLMYVVEDILSRYHRMQGRPTLWLPGTDHAGIETQVVYEKKLAEEGKDRFDLGRDEFYKQVMGFTLSSQSTILDQMRTMGFSADWSKLKFTLDKDITGTVYETFKQLHEDGYIYRGNRIVNWCSRCQAAFADIELDRQERKDQLVTISYGPLQIATVRPETIFADVAVAVHPEDERYKHLIGQQVTVPIIDKQIPIIADKYVQPEFGTGALKVTPGHDPNDYEIGLRHNLPEISVIDPDGKLINVPEEFAGLSVEEGRAAIITALEEAGKLVKSEAYEHVVSIHDRCGCTIEPLISEQWFLRIKDLNQNVIEAIESDKVQFHPKKFKKVALDWLKQEHDWCISRQIWWGIRIPIYYKTSNDPDKDSYTITDDEQEAIEYYGEGNYRAEEDTFDTWFSSGQWPYATLMATGDFDSFYPTTVMGTARDILHKWVTRMIMFGLYKTEEVPFEHVYLWGMVTDEKGQKLSKSKGNYGDPMEITAKYGTDALRLALSASNTPGSNSALTEKQVEAMRNFNNKLWNVARFILDKVDDSYQPAKPTANNLADEWILAKLNQATNDVTRLIDEYRFNEATQYIYHLLWDDFADWYLESSKVEPNQDLLIHGLETILKLLHPFAPFISEAIWQQLKWQDNNLIISTWPVAEELGKKEQVAINEFEKLQNIITEIRAIGTDIDLSDASLYHRQSQLLEDSSELVVKLAGVDSCQSVSDGRGLPIPGTTIDSWLDVDERTINKYQQTLENRLEEVNSRVNTLKAKLDNKAYTHNAPKAVVDETKNMHKEALEASETLSEALKRLEKAR
ncbi:MAG: valine--tRNA ligase, partial [Candidatus Saccharimonadales bacterium]